MAIAPACARGSWRVGWRIGRVGGRLQVIQGALEDTPGRPRSRLGDRCRAVLRPHPVTQRFPSKWSPPSDVSSLLPLIVSGTTVTMTHGPEASSFLVVRILTGVPFSFRKWTRRSLPLSAL